MSRHTAIGAIYLGTHTEQAREIEVRYHFTVSPGSPQVYAQPEEHPSIDVTRIDIKSGDAWVKVDDFLHDLILVDDIDAVHAWLFECAAEDKAAARDDAADHRRELLREDAA